MEFAELKLKKPELLKAAEEFAVDVDKTWTNKKIVEEIEAFGVTADMYIASDLYQSGELTPDVKAVPRAGARKPAGSEVLIKMTRQNPTYEIRGYRFTKKDPFVVVDEENANYILELEGFSIASPKAAQEYYA